MMDFDTFLDATRATLISSTLLALNLSIKSFHQDTCVFSDVILVSNYHNYKGKTVKVPPYHSTHTTEIISPKKN